MMDGGCAMTSAEQSSYVGRMAVSQAKERVELQWCCWLFVVLCEADVFTKRQGVYRTLLFLMRTRIVR